MATAYKPTDKLANDTLDAEVDTFVKKLHSTIQDARSKMSDEELERADEEARSILDRASAAAKGARHRA
jgi:hypothetical protein